MHRCLLVIKEFFVLLELKSDLSIEFIKLFLKHVPFLYFQEVFPNLLLKFDQWNLVGFVWNTLIKAPDHFLHLLVLNIEFGLVFSASSHQGLDFSLMFIKLIIAREIFETLINTFNVIFSNETLNSVLLIWLHFLHIVMNFISKLVKGNLLVSYLTFY